MIKRLIFFLAFLVTAGLVTATIIVSSTYTTTGETLKKLEFQKERLSQENKDLERLILEKTSLHYLTELAQSRGYVPPQDSLTISDPSSPVALSN